MRQKYPPTINVSAIGLPDAYAKLVKECMTNGAIKRRFYGKPVNTYSIISTTEIKRPLLEPVLHPQFPTKGLHLGVYKKEWEPEYDWKAQGFEYNYGNRLRAYPQALTTTDEDRDYYNKASQALEIDEAEFINQLQTISENIATRIEKGGECLVSNRDLAITWIPDRDMYVKEDQPCLQRLQFFVHSFPVEAIFYKGDQADYFIEKSPTERMGYKNGIAEMHCMWRSRDLFSAWNSNMVALIEMVNKEIMAPNHLELIRVVDFCNCLHIYESDWDAAALVKPAVINPMYMR